MKWTAPVVLVLVWCAAPATARVLHVSPNGGTEAPGTIEKPVRLDRAVLQAVAGDVIRLAAGNYQLSNGWLPLVFGKAGLVVEGGWDASYQRRDPFGSPSVLLAPSEFDKPLVFIPPTPDSVVVDGLTLDGGPGGRYGSKGVAEGAYGRVFPLVRVERAGDVTLRNCTLLNSPGHAVAGSVRVKLTVDNAVMVNHRVSAVTAWGVQQDAALIVRNSTILGVWAEKPGGERGEAVDIQRDVKVTLDGNILDDIQGACVRVGRGNPPPTLLGNAVGRCGAGVVRAWPQPGPPVDLPLMALEQEGVLDARLNTQLARAVNPDTGAFAAHAAVKNVPDGGKPPTPAYAPRSAMTAVGLLGLDPRAGARFKAP